jgi:AcrR family transcriptional regulator
MSTEETPSVDRLYDRLPPRPGRELDRLLDAVERCLVRYGVRRTSMTDVAREMGVARATLYRQVSSLDEAMALLSSRRFHRFLDGVVELVRDAGGISSEVFVQATADAVRRGLDDPVMHRVLQDEPDLIGSYLTGGRLPIVAEQVIEAMTPLLKAAMATGHVRMGDPRIVTSWIVRIVVSLAAVPAPDDELEDTIRVVLQPLLDPTDPTRSGGR